jgi:nanoRNase/pAp phosphatase (c-di-AMP/oligoRNAs hydrolase)
MPLDENLQGARPFSAAMLEWSRGRGKVIIIVHDNPDPDCLASALALCYLFVSTTGEEPLIAFTGMIGRSENLIMAKVLEIPLVPLEIVDLAEYGVVCMLDTQPGTGNNSLDPAVVDVVIDHHPLRERTKACRWVDVRDDYGVTATILYEYLLAHGLPIDAKLATALFYAIKSDTQDLGREANLPDKEAYLNLFPLADKQLLYEITNPSQPLEYFRTIRRTLDHARIYGSAVVVDMQRVAYPELVAEMADFLLPLEGVKAVLSCGEYLSEIILSIRTNSPDLNAGEMVRRVVEGVGVGGGHTFMGGGKIAAFPLGSDSLNKLKKLVIERFMRELDVVGNKPVTIE